MLRFYSAVLLFACFALTASAVTVSTTASQCTGSTGTATANASGGSPPYTYAWSNGGTTSQITGLAPGYYSRYGDRCLGGDNQRIRGSARFTERSD